VVIVLSFDLSGALAGFHHDELAHHSFIFVAKRVAVVSGCLTKHE
jgi:hypothetical protein